MTINEIKREWDRNGELCITEGCDTRKREGSDKCTNCHGERTLVDTVDGPQWTGPPLAWCSLIGTRKLVLL